MTLTMACDATAFESSQLPRSEVSSFEDDKVNVSLTLAKNISN